MGSGNVHNIGTQFKNTFDKRKVVSRWFRWHRRVIC